MQVGYQEIERGGPSANMLLLAVDHMLYPTVGAVVNTTTGKRVIFMQ